MCLQIRQAIYSDIPYFYEICLKTANNGKDATNLFNDSLLVGQFYAAPYVLHDISLCFIVEEDFIPQGYIIVTLDTILFNTWLETEWLPQLRKRYSLLNFSEKIKSKNEYNLISLLHKNAIITEEKMSPWLIDYPAHLHIDLLPSIQGKGFGKKLMNTLFFELHNKKCSGIHLGVDNNNINAIGFYKKIGFVILEKTDWGFIMGKKL